ncbi:hypothetical protein PSTG_14683 [Puccinia striiformis f. sp. tritici PST-78]|uniref:DNA mismatch repair proteins mutS family domain-containing protein n=1 Tax=Puccinia striiformis f. sp. tritici PST-78 TaxID=1165861 RepID=A0A0L0UXZ1_9BASI|nr:hypothetical protein PSTG_14683 [Puccinia striiformis f. sp. tritici PST-78]
MASTICLTRLAQHSPRQITITRISFIRSLASTSTRGSTKSKTSTTLEKVCDILGISKLIKPTIDAEKVVKKTRAKRKTTESVKQKTDQVAPKNEDPSKDVGSPQKDEAGETAAPSKKQTAKKSTKPKKAVSSSPKAKKTTTTEVDKTPTSESSSKSSPDPSKESPQDPSAKSAQDPSNEFSQPSNESSHDSTKKSSQEPPKKSSEEPSTKSSEEPPKKSSQKPSKKTSKEPSKECTRKATNKPSVKTKKIVLPVPKESIPQEITSAETRIINSLEPKKTFPPEPEQTSPAETEKRSTPEPETTLPPEPEKTSPSKPEQTSPPEPEKTSPSEPEKTSLPGPEKSSSAEPEKTLPAEPEKTSPPELGKTSSEPEKTSPPEPETTPPREPEIISSPQPEEISPAEPDETSSSEPAKTSPAEPAKTSPPEPDKTSPPEPEETSLPETAKTSPAEPGQTSPLEPEYTSPPEPELTSIPETAKTSPAKPRKTSPAEPGKTSPAEPGKASLLEPEKPASSEMKPDAVYFDQAVTTAKLLNIKQGETQFSGEVYPCTRFPLSSLQKHLETLLNKHRRVVAISEEEISSDEDGEIRRTFRIIRPASQKTTPAETKKTTSLEPKKTSVPEPAKTAPPETKPDAVARTSLELLPLPQTKGTQKKKAITIDSALIQFDKFVTIGSPPSQNPSLYSKKVPKFVLDSRLRFPDAILLTCVGSFYEVYFDQAVEVAELLNIKQGKTQFSGYAYPFTGFPLSSLQRNLKTLVNEHNRVVAIAEEETPTDEEIERRIVRIITPGTIVDENLIDDESYNYLLSVHQNQLAWLDVSTGSYFQTTCDGGESELLDQICRISPKEIIISADSSFCIPPNSKAAKLSILITKIKNLDSSSSLSNQGLTAEVLIAIYIKRNLLPVRAATRPLCVDALRHLKLDAEAIDSLEIIRTQNGKSEAGSLLSTISRTLTSPGKRLLRDRIMSPSRVLAEIETRLDLVEKLVVNHTSREDIQDTLREIEDIDYVRLLQRINLGQGTIQDLASMIRILKAIETISSTLSAITVPSPLGSHLALQECISDAIGDLTQASAAQAATENTSIEATKDFFSPVTWNVRFNLSKELGSMHDRLNSLMEKGKQLQAKYRADLDSKDLKLQVVPKLGAVLSIIKARKAGQELTSKLDKINGQTLIDNGSRVVAAVPEWTKMHASIERLRQELIQAEQRIMKKLFDQVTSDHVSLNQSFQALAALDVAQSFATFAVDSNCVRPSINPKRSTTIVNGRHPIAERALSSSLNGSFIPNSIVMHDRDGLVQIITGPNNGGKSTYLRQLGIIHILAQAGSFVPAESAKLGVVHQIFTRFGSFDNVVLGKGTFLIEMEETCKILKSADQMSLVLMDEVGRGTGIEDGLSIAYGVLRYLIEKSQCRTLFSTHLPHVGSLLLREDTCANGDLNGLKPADYMKIDRLGFFCFGSSKINAHTEESQGEEILNFSYEIQRGLNPNSSGIDIAQLVGLPKEVIAHATTIKSQLGNHSLKFQQDHPQSKKT